MGIDIIDLPLRLTSDDYHRMIDTGAFGDLRVELLDGRVVPMSPMNPAHASALTRTSRLFDALFDETMATVRQQCPVALDEGWEPHPDIVVAKPGDWEDSHPRAEDIHLIIEISDSTLREDLVRKMPRYARNGVAEVWIVDLTANTVHVYRDPDSASRYLTELDAKLADRISIAAFPGVSIPASGLFPASRVAKLRAH